MIYSKMHPDSTGHEHPVYFLAIHENHVHVKSVCMTQTARQVLCGVVLTTQSTVFIEQTGYCSGMWAAGQRQTAEARLQH